MYSSKPAEAQVFVPPSQRPKQMPRGQSPKKAGEVQDLVNHVPLLFKSAKSAPTHALDIGSGRVSFSSYLL